MKVHWCHQHAMVKKTGKMLYLVIRNDNTSEDIHLVLQPASCIYVFIFINQCCSYLILPHPHPSALLEAVHCKKKKTLKED